MSTNRFDQDLGFVLKSKSDNITKNSGVFDELTADTDRRVLGPRASSTAAQSEPAVASA